MSETNNIPSVQGAILPAPRSGHVSCQYGDNLYVWGGYMDVPGGPFSEERYHSPHELWSYSIEAEKWKLDLADGTVPPGTSGGCAANVNQYLYLFGGFHDINSNQLYRLDLRKKRWKKIETQGDSPSPRDKALCWIYRNRLYVFGGFGPEPQTLPRYGQWVWDTTTGWTPDTGRGWNNHLFAYCLDTNQWNEVKTTGPCPSPRAAYSGDVIGNRLFIFGGRLNQTRMDDLHCLNLETMQWSGRIIGSGDIPEGRTWSTLTRVSDTHLLLYGGFDNDCVPLGDCRVLNTNNMEWTQVSLPSRPRLWHTACSGPDGGEVLIFGGCSNNILGSEENLHCNDVIHIHFTPKSLLRFALDVVVQYRHILQDHLHHLPLSIIEILEKRLETRVTRHDELPAEYHKKHPCVIS
ncbi:kelch domain-containing protein 2-like [Glandiceps talaboti]